MDDTKFWDKTAPGYVKAPMREGDVPSYEYTMGRSLSYLSAKDSILEIGCGSGATALRFAKSVCHVTASDISPVMIEHANQKKAEEGMQNIAFHAGTVFDHDPRDQRFDAVFALNVLHLVPDVDAALAHIAKLVKPGGYFISKTGCINSTRPAALRMVMKAGIKGMQMVGKAPRHIQYLTTKGLAQQIEKSGFQIVETSDGPSQPPVHFVVGKRV